MFNAQDTSQPAHRDDTGSTHRHSHTGVVSSSAAERVVMRRADGNPINVLVVDDEAVLAEMVSRALRYEGMTSATATHVRTLSRALKAIHMMIGVRTTYVPVMNPETEAAVVCRPTVWTICARP